MQEGKGRRARDGRGGTGAGEWVPGAHGGRALGLGQGGQASPASGTSCPPLASSMAGDLPFGLSSSIWDRASGPFSCPISSIFRRFACAPTNRPMTTITIHVRCMCVFACVGNVCVCVCTRVCARVNVCAACARPCGVRVRKSLSPPLPRRRAPFLLPNASDRHPLAHIALRGARVWQERAAGGGWRVAGGSGGGEG